MILDRAIANNRHTLSVSNVAISTMCSHQVPVTFPIREFLELVETVRHTILSILDVTISKLISNQVRTTSFSSLTPSFFLFDVHIGPGAYKPEDSGPMKNAFQSSPAYTFGTRHKDYGLDNTPGERTCHHSCSRRPLSLF